MTNTTRTLTTAAVLALTACSSEAGPSFTFCELPACSASAPMPGALTPELEDPGPAFPRDAAVPAVWRDVEVEAGVQVVLLEWADGTTRVPFDGTIELRGPIEPVDVEVLATGATLTLRDETGFLLLAIQRGVPADVATMRDAYALPDEIDIGGVLGTFEPRCTQRIESGFGCSRDWVSFDLVVASDEGDVPFGAGTDDVVQVNGIAYAVALGGAFERGGSCGDEVCADLSPAGLRVEVVHPDFVAP